MNRLLLLFSVLLLLGAPGHRASAAELLYSTSPDLSDPAPLEGARFGPEAEIFVFVDSDEPPAPTASTVGIFILNNRSLFIDRNGAPFVLTTDFVSTTPEPITADLLAAGSNSIVFYGFAPIGQNIAAQFQFDAPPTIGELARSEGFTTFADALDSSGLETPGYSSIYTRQFTAFVPSNEAFDTFLADAGLTLSQLVADSALLQQVIGYHLKAGASRVEDLAGLPAIGTLNSRLILVDTKADPLVLNGAATIVREDLLASNGVLQVVDQVLVPPASLTEVAAQLGATRYVEAVEAAGLTPIFDGPGFRTALVPTDEAFDALVSSLGVPYGDLLADTVTLRALLQYHTAHFVAPVADLLAVGSVPTAQGSSYDIEAVGEEVIVNGTARVLDRDFTTASGYVHLIDSVLELPEQDTFEILFSAEPDLSNAQPLAGAALSSLDGVTIFIESGSGQPVVRGALVGLNNFFTFDFDTPLTFDPSGAAPGANQALAIVLTSTGNIISQANFTLAE